ncbi:MAG: hypothetical protein OEW64_13415 [Gammaproteobacteria bacterium]|nr:hypothetical protein [Gammaproteobacteria bacterium]MDH5305081.1 hypothetical protein [Gammaproteobacteria bacterium]MDH5322927.1 hypothetical protein [Gammaproteobacteria bacterium]
MEEQDALFALAEFAVGLAGFSAVAVALACRAGQWEAASAYRRESLLVRSLSVGMFAFAPVTILFLGIEGPALWQYSSVLLALWYTSASIFALRRFLTLPADAMSALSRPLFIVGQLADESPRDCRRPFMLRGYSDDKSKQIFPGSPGTSGSHAARARTIL